MGEMVIITANQRKVYIRRLSLLVIALLIVIGFSATSNMILHASAMGKDGEPAQSSVPVVMAGTDKSSLLSVEPGDTLWSIAKKYGPDHIGVKAYVQEMIEYNDLDSANLKVGQVIRLP
ncbi:LysM peptidoglycan-binding domain-containing protein [Paenibacillus sp. TRM 82003]|nr:LysM peptidoglycan-binding domain-containing protein [Paenibacillus sp. TRM 82003]